MLKFQYTWKICIFKYSTPEANRDKHKLNDPDSGAKIYYCPFQLSHSACPPVSWMTSITMPVDESWRMAMESSPNVSSPL